MNSNFKDESQKYLDEMMRLYSLGKSASVNTVAEPFGSVPKPPQENRPSEDILDEEVNELPQQQPPETVPEPFPRPQPVPPMNEMQNVPSRPQMPPMQERPEERPPMEQNRPENQRPQAPLRPPMPPQTEQRPQPVPPRPEPPERPQPQVPPRPQPPQNEFGFMKIEVRTGENGIPVPDAAVTVARRVGDSEEMIFSGTTNSSGAIEKLRLPAPANLKNTDPGSFGNYAAYNVNVFSKGFYREAAHNVPVFSGITTIQRFNLVPLPFNFKDDGQEIIVTSEQPEI